MIGQDQLVDRRDSLDPLTALHPSIPPPPPLTPPPPIRSRAHPRNKKRDDSKSKDWVDMQTSHHEESCHRPPTLSGALQCARRTMVLGQAAGGHHIEKIHLAFLGRCPPVLGSVALASGGRRSGVRGWVVCVCEGASVKLDGSSVGSWRVVTLRIPNGLRNVLRALSRSLQGGWLWCGPCVATPMVSNRRPGPTAQRA